MNQCPKLHRFIRHHPTSSSPCLHDLFCHLPAYIGTCTFKHSIMRMLRGCTKQKWMPSLPVKVLFISWKCNPETVCHTPSMLCRFLGGNTNHIRDDYIVLYILCYPKLIFSSHNIIYSHENASGYYRVSAFFISKAVTDLIPLRFIPNVVFALITYFMIGNGTFVTYVPVCQWRYIYETCMQMWHMSSTRTCMYMFYSKTKVRTHLVKVFWVFTSWISGKKTSVENLWHHLLAARHHSFLH